MRIKKRIVDISIALFISLIIVLISYCRVFDVFELATFDLRFKVRPAQKISPEIVIIEIAKDTLDQIGAWPIDREFYAYLVEILTRYDARSIIFDIIFSKQQNPVSDQKLIDAVKISNRCYLPNVFWISDKKDVFPQAVDVEAEPSAEFARSAKGVGHINIISDKDGKRRRLPLFIKHKQDLFPQLSFLAICDYFNKNPYNLKIKPKNYIEINPNLRIPIDEEGMTLINFAGKWTSSFKLYSFIDILKSDIQIKNNEKPRINLNNFKDKICFIGLTAAGTHDLHPTPIQANYPMLGAHANIVNSILNNSFIVRTSKIINIFILLILSVVTGLFVFRLRPFYSLLCVLFLFFGFTFFAFSLFAFLNLWIDLFYPLLLISFVYLFSTFYKYIAERNKRMIMERELDIAHRIQKSFLKENPPQKKEIEIAARMDTAKAVGGDLYDFIEISDKQTGIMIGDVSGKGVPAALFMAKAVSEFRFHSKTQKNAKDVLYHLNDQIAREPSSGLFVTLYYVTIDTEKMLMHIVDAGHLPIIKASPKTKSELIEVEGSMAIGIMEAVEYSEQTIPIKSGDVFLIYTDGVTEARNTNKEEFQTEKIKKSLDENKDKPVEEIIRLLFKDIYKFQARAPQHDDITAIAFRIL